MKKYFPFSIYFLIVNIIQIVAFPLIMLFAGSFFIVINLGMKDGSSQEINYMFYGTLLCFILFLVLFYTIKFNILPIFFRFTEKQDMGKNFIELLKKRRYTVLSIAAFIDIISYFLLFMLPDSQIRYTENAFTACIYAFIIGLAFYLFTGAGLFGSYLALFNQWKIKD